MYHYAAPSPFPPSFEGSPWSYGFGLFGDVVAAALALAMLASILIEPIRSKQISALLNNRVALPPIQPGSPLFIYRSATISMLTFVVMRTMPDAIWMLAWGEVPDQTIRIMLAFDLWMDAASLVPLFFSMMCWAWGRQVIPQMLIADMGRSVHTRPAFDVVWRNSRIVLAVVLIAILVTIGKANA